MCWEPKDSSVESTDAHENLRATFLQPSSLTGTESMYHLFIITCCILIIHVYLLIP